MKEAAGIEPFCISSHRHICESTASRRDLGKQPEMGVQRVTSKVLVDFVFNEKDRGYLGPWGGLPLHRAVNYVAKLLRPEGEAPIIFFNGLSKLYLGGGWGQEPLLNEIILFPP